MDGTTLNQSNSVSTLLQLKKAQPMEREQGINYNFNEMKDFFMKHYNNSNKYHDELQSLNLRERIKAQRGKITTSGQTAGLEISTSMPNLRALKR